MITIYGIKNCDTMKKTFKWFDSRNVEYVFVDYKKDPPSKELSTFFLDVHPWEVVLNKRGTTWRKLDDETKTNMDTKLAGEIMLQNPSIIKRPIIVKDNSIHIGFDEKIFNKLI